MRHCSLVSHPLLLGSRPRIVCLTEPLCHPCFTSHCVDTVCTWTQSSARAVLSVTQPHEHFESGIGHCADRLSFSIFSSSPSSSFNSLFFFSSFFLSSPFLLYIFYFLPVLPFLSIYLAFYTFFSPFFTLYPFLPFLPFLLSTFFHC